jgi:anti-anti-sigma regulatory factor
MPLEIEVQGELCQARLSGELTTFNAGDMQDELLSLLNHASVRLDLEGLTELDACGAQLLAILQVEAARAGKSLHIHGVGPIPALALHWLAIAFEPAAKAEGA